MHRKSIEAAEKLRSDDESDADDQDSCSSRSVTNNGPTSMEDPRKEMKRMSPIMTAVTTSCQQKKVQRKRKDSNNKIMKQNSSQNNNLNSTCSTSSSVSPSSSCHSPPPQNQFNLHLHHQNSFKGPEDLRSSSIANLRAKAMEHSAKVLGIPSHPHDPSSLSPSASASLSHLYSQSPSYAPFAAARPIY